MAIVNKHYSHVLKLTPVLVYVLLSLKNKMEQWCEEMVGRDIVYKSFSLVVVESVFVLEHESWRVFLDLLAEHSDQRERVTQEQDEEDVTEHIHLHRTLL